jgi:hypothetical protein
MRGSALKKSTTNDTTLWQSFDELQTLVDEDECTVSCFVEASAGALEIKLVASDFDEDHIVMYVLIVIDGGGSC